MREIYVPHRLGEKWAIRDMRTDELMRNWRKGNVGLIWRGTEEDCYSLCALLNRGDEVVREETSKSQRIHFMNQRKKSTKPRVVKTLFSRCTECGKMVKKDHQCAEGATP
jgi:hypothetical protein